MQRGVKTIFSFKQLFNEVGTDPDEYLRKIET